MWNWLAKLFKSGQDNGTSPSGEILVSDEDYAFRVGTTPMLPPGLANLKITEIRPGLLFLDHFDAELTVDQKARDRTIADIAAATRCYRWAASYHNLVPAIQTSVRLHGDNLVLSDSHYSGTTGPEADLSTWLELMGWSDDRPFEVYQSKSDRPLEDGYFSCLRIVVDGACSSLDECLNWTPLPDHAPTMLDTLAAFVDQELTVQPWSGSRCEAYLRDCYRAVATENQTHPVFALIDYPIFDMGSLRSTFAGSILSRQELRLWSRPTYFHK